jgi:RecB family endonuclease NucS
VDLEDWIERDPWLLDEDLTIVGRQVWLDAGSPDLVAVDSAGRLVLVEIKRDRSLARDFAGLLASAAMFELSGELATLEMGR